MKVAQRKAVSPIIATLLLIAIAVASGIIVYVFTGSLAGNLTKSGGSQVTEQVSMDAYSYQTPPSLTIYLRNTGPSTINMSQVYFDGTSYVAASMFSSASTSCTLAVNGESVQCAPGGTVVLTLSEASTTGQSHTVKVVTADGAPFPFSVVAGSTG